jgi:hypothetical protein
VAGYLLGLWGLPVHIVEAVAFHHRPLDLPIIGFDLVAAVHVAGALADEVLGGGAGVGGAERFDRGLMDHLGLWDELPRWWRIAEQEAGLPEDIALR